MTSARARRMIANRQRQLLLALVFATTGCVTTGRYEAAVHDAKQAQSALTAERAAHAQDRTAQEAELARQRRASASAAERDAERERAFGNLRNERELCAKQLDDANALNQGLRGELERAGKNADQLLSAKGSLAAALDQARARLDELRRAQAAAEGRAAQFRQIAGRLKHMVDAGQLQIVLRRGRMVVVLPSDVLFDSGKAQLSATGREVITSVARALSGVEGRQFQVAGHTDDQPIRWSGFASNWELSTERALTVVRVLVENGMKPEVLSAAGYGEFDPAEPNESSAGRARNRRIEISLQPNIDEIVELPEAG